MTQPVVERLHVDHQRMARVLQMLETVLAQSTPANLDDQLDILLCGIEYMAEYRDSLHHPLEDRLFDAMNDRLSPSQRQQVEDNRKQHAGLQEATRSLLGMFDGPRDKQWLARLRTAGLAFVAEQRGHMAWEERVIFPLAEACLRTSDWQRVARELATHSDPMYDQQQQRFAVLFDYILPDQPYGALDPGRTGRAASASHAWGRPPDSAGLARQAIAHAGLASDLYTRLWTLHNEQLAGSIQDCQKSLYALTHQPPGLVFSDHLLRQTARSARAVDQVLGLMAGYAERVARLQQPADNAPGTDPREGASELSS